MEKCFCHLNGYAVKDATARTEIEELKKNKVSTEQLNIERATINSSISRVDTRVGNLEKAVSNIPKSAEDITFDAEGIEATNTEEAILEVKRIAESVSSDVAVTNLQNDVSGLQNQLTAEDGHAFRFAVNSEGEYGYIVPDSEGADTFIPFNSMDLSLLVSALAHSNLGITEESTYEEICTALANKFPPELVDKVSTWSTDGIDAGENSSVVSKSKHVVTFTSAFSDGHTAYCESNNIPVGEYEKMYIDGYVKFTKGSLGNVGTLDVITDDGTVIKIECTNYGQNYRIDREIKACSNLRLAFNGRYQQVEAKFSVRLYN